MHYPLTSWTELRILMLENTGHSSLDLMKRWILCDRHLFIRA